MRSGQLGGFLEWFRWVKVHLERLSQWVSVWYYWYQIRHTIEPDSTKNCKLAYCGFCSTMCKFLHLRILQAKFCARRLTLRPRRISPKYLISRRPIWDDMTPSVCNYLDCHRNGRFYDTRGRILSASKRSSGIRYWRSLALACRRYREGVSKVP